MHLPHLRLPATLKTAIPTIIIIWLLLICQNTRFSEIIYCVFKEIIHSYINTHKQNMVHDQIYHDLIMPIDGLCKMNACASCGVVAKWEDPV